MYYVSCSQPFALQDRWASANFDGCREELASAMDDIACAAAASRLLERTSVISPYRKSNGADGDMKGTDESARDNRDNDIVVC
ncbi:unnamed protein product [Gongylonema pulchrum]|uniref:Uncharacterized protein n=1 Tax=Gongylonema pulchrum TaxID=637853 RepID=A0A183DUB4_9BILA|nr:unnamed protein product [Gongylonema pulchrum]